MSPRVSVLMPVRNAAVTIGEALGSLRAQTFTDFEIVLIDDRSGDDTAGTARALWPDDGRLRVLHSSESGLIAALRQGLGACRAELVARMDADDLCGPERLARQVAYLEAHPDIAVVSCQVSCFARGGIGEGYRLYQQWLNALTEPHAIAREIFVESPLPHPSVVFRKSVIDEHGGYRDRGWPEDYDLWLRLCTRGVRFAKVPDILLHWRDTPERHSRQHPRYSPDAFLRCKAHHLHSGPLAELDEIVIWGAGRIGRRLHRYLDAEGTGTRAFVDIDARKIGRSLHGIPVVPPEGLDAYRDRFVVAAVGSRGARTLIRKRLRAMGWREGSDFLCAA
jgi:glycosyltransferase involved in cell wall biosynthesis